jgi:hypothetical protein
MGRRVHPLELPCGRTTRCVLDGGNER